MAFQPLRFARPALIVLNFCFRTGCCFNLKAHPFRQMQNLDLIIAIVAVIADVTLLFCLAYRKLIGRFALFFAYTAFGILGLLIELSVAHNTFAFYTAYWTIRAVGSLLSLAVIIGIFWPAVELVNRRLGLPGFLLPLALLIFIDFAFWRTVQHSFGTSRLGITASIIYSFDLAVSFVEVVIFLMCLWLRPKYRKIWESYNFYVISGFAAISMASLLAYATRLKFGAAFEGWFHYLPSFAFILVTIAWIYIFSRPEPEDEGGSTPTSPEQLDDLFRKGTDLFDEIDRIFRRPMRCNTA